MSVASKTISKKGFKIFTVFPSIQIFFFILFMLTVDSCLCNRLCKWG